jgi:hypothetical protein
MEALGSQVHVITEPDAKSGFLGAWKAQYRTTAPAIARRFPRLDVLFIGAGTTGTLMGCSRWFRSGTGRFGWSRSTASGR